MEKWKNHTHFALIACVKFKRFIAQEKRFKSKISYYHRSEISYDHILVFTHVVVFCFCAGFIICIDQDLHLVWLHIHLTNRHHCLVTYYYCQILEIF